MRRAVLDAAAFLFGERGVDAVSLRDIATEADVQLALLPRYIGNRAALIDAVFEDLSSKLAQELLDRPLERLSFDHDSTIGRWMRILIHRTMSGADASRLADSFNPVQAIAALSQDIYGLEPFDARVRGAQIVAHSLGWRLFESYLVAAGDLESTPIETLRDEHNAVNRRIGATPLRPRAEDPLADGRQQGPADGETESPRGDSNS